MARVLRGCVDGTLRTQPGVGCDRCVTGKSKASAQHATVKRPKRNVSVRASSPNQLPVRIARRRIAGECPDIGDIGDLIRVTIDNRCRPCRG